MKPLHNLKFVPIIYSELLAYYINGGFMKTALYMRMSTDKQENSIASQKEALERYAKAHKMEIVQAYIDEGISGRTVEKRPAFLQMIEDSSKGVFDSVLVYDSSRFARNLEESIVYKSALRKNNVVLISATEPAADDDNQLITDAMLGALNEMYSRKLSKAVKRGMAYNAQQGKYQVPPPFGYIKKNGKMVIVPEEAETVKKIFELFLQRPSYFNAATVINNIGIKTRKGFLWGSRDIKRILTNSAYIGFVSYDGNTYKGNHSAIINNETFAKVKKLIENKPTAYKARPERQYKHWLSGILKCCHCGQNMSCVYPKKGSPFYRCHGYAVGKCNYSSFILIKDIEDIAISSIKNLIDNDEINNYDTFDTFDNRGIKEAEYSNLQIAYKKVQAKLKRYKEAYSCGVDTLEEYKENKNKCVLEENSIKKRIAETGNSLFNEVKPKSLTNSPLYIVDILNDIDKPIEEKNAAVKAIIQQITYNRETGVLSVYYFQ